MKKIGLILSIIGVFAVIAVATVAIILNGSDMSGLNYVRLSVNPEIEFVCDGEIVVTCNPMNDEAKQLIAQEQFLNLNVEDACKKFVDLCTRAGYIDLNAKDNAVKVDCVSGLTQSLEIKVYRAVNEYLKDSEIFGVVIEATNDGATIKKAKEADVSINKYSLIESCLKLNKEETFERLQKLSQTELIEKIKNLHEKLGNQTQTYSEEDLINKSLLIDFNRVQFAKHMDSITPESQSKFKELYAKNQKELKNDMQKDFNESYNVWRTNHINFVS